MTPRDIEHGDHRTPLTVLTGFLGSGKTTLLNHILSGDHGLRVAVLVNDFGAINVDAELIVGIESDVISLANGCICCTIREDLAATVVDTLDRPERPEYILLEASGVAEPSAICSTFAGDILADRIRLDSIMCVVDAEQTLAVPDLMELKIRQMAFADMVILNKVDLVDQSQIDQITAWLDSRFHRYRLVQASHGVVPLEVLLSVGRFDPSRADVVASRYPPSDTDHGQTFSTWSLQTDEPLCLDGLADNASRLPVGVYRCKGIVHTTEEPDRRTVLQVVGKRVTITVEDDWGDRPRETRIVAIGAHGAFDDDQLRSHFAGCTCSPSNQLRFTARKETRV